MVPLLEVRQVTKRFGGLVALSDVSLEVREQEIVGLIGPNGAGKTTLFAVISGYQRPHVGRVAFRGRDITRMSPHVIAGLGMIRTFQLMKPFADMTVLENVMVGALLRARSVAEAQRRARDTLEFCGLDRKASTLGHQLTGVDKKKLEMARALAAEPQLLLLDEVMAGLTPSEAQQAVELVRRIQRRGVALLVVEHVMEVIMPISHRVVVLDHGRKIADGTPSEVVKDPTVIRAYLGDRFPPAAERGAEFA